jgi:hypothetical protein
VIDNTDAKWMINGQNIFRFRDNIWTIYNSSNMPIDLALYSNYGLYTDSKGRIYCYLVPFANENISGPLLIVFDGSQWKSFSFPIQVTSMTIDKWSDRMYFRTWGDTVYQYNGTGSFSDLASYARIDLGGQYSISNFSTYHDSLLIFLNQGNAGYQTDTGRSGFIIRDANGNITQNNFPDASPNILLSGVIGPDGKTIYMVKGNPVNFGGISDDTLYTFDGSIWNTIPAKFIGGYDWINFLKNSNDGVLWISYGWNVMTSYKNHQFQSHDLSISIPYSHISDFAFDSHNVKWLACWEGLVRYNIP